MNLRGPLAFSVDATRRTWCREFCKMEVVWWKFGHLQFNIIHSLASSFPKISLRPQSAPSAPEPERTLKGNSVWLRGWRKEHSVQPNYSRSSGSKRTAYLLQTVQCLDSLAWKKKGTDEIHSKVEKISWLPVRRRISRPHPSRWPTCDCRRLWRGKTLRFLGRKNVFCGGGGVSIKQWNAG